MRENAIDRQYTEWGQPVVSTITSYRLKYLPVWTLESGGSNAPLIIMNQPHYRNMPIEKLMPIMKMQMG